MATVPQWASQESTKVATASQFAAPRDGDASFWSAYGSLKWRQLRSSQPPGDGEASFWVAYDTTQHDPPGVHESDDSFAVRSHQRRRGLILVCV